MGKRLTSHVGRISFVVYLCLVALIPITHCHADDVLSESTACETGHGPGHLPFFSVVQCCELHQNGHTKSDEFHIHFLTDDQGRATRHNPTDKSPSAQNLAATDEGYRNHSLYEDIGVVVSNADCYQEALRPYSSGLSPPLS